MTFCENLKGGGGSGVQDREREECDQSADCKQGLNERASAEAWDIKVGLDQVRAADLRTKGKEATGKQFFFVFLFVCLFVLPRTVNLKVELFVSQRSSSSSSSSSSSRRSCSQETLHPGQTSNNSSPNSSRMCVFVCVCLHSPISPLQSSSSQSTPAQPLLYSSYR